jgi:hypothetical protein
VTLGCYAGTRQRDALRLEKPLLLLLRAAVLLADTINIRYSSSGSTDGFTHITSVNPAAPPGATFWQG